MKPEAGSEATIPSPEERISGGEMIVRALEELGTEVVFGLPGGTVIPLYDKIYAARFRHVLVRHEQAAAHAADGYARASGRAGVCFATSGPGATNLVTGIATANLDSVPLVAIAGQVATTAVGTDAFQEADTLGITLPVVKHSFQVRSSSEVGRAVRGAFQIAESGRPGPVLIDLPVDVQREMGDYHLPDRVDFPGYHPDVPPDLSDLPAAAEALLRAERPVLLAGGGANRPEAAPLLRSLAETLGIPVAHTLMGKGAFPDGHPLALGPAGMHGTPAANRALSSSDLVIALGTRFSERTTGRRDRFAQTARVLHLDRDRAERNKNVTSELFLQGDMAILLSALGEACGLPTLRAPEGSAEEREGEGSYAHIPGHRGAWLRRIDAWKRLVPGLAAYMGEGRDADPRWGGPDPSPGVAEETLTAPRAIRAACLAAQAALGEGALAVTEVGQHQMWSLLHWRATRPRTFLSSGGLGTMGFGLPAAMGATFARKDEPVLCIAGDGSLLMNVAELDTCARYGLPVKVLLLDNSCLGMVRQWQELFFEKRYSQTLYDRSPDFPKLAESLGAAAIRVTRTEELRPAVERAFGIPGPVLIHVPIDREEKVFPMVPPGASIEEILLGD
jgi:acetolactate synthase-1/2/3 large subunit